MSKYCAKRVNSENRALVKHVITSIESHPENIDLSGLKVDTSIFPAQALKAAAQEILRTKGGEALQYSSSHDYMPLKAQLAEHYAQFNVALQAENFTITNGSTQAIDMVMKVLVNEGDTILAEAPLYWRVRQTMSMYRPNIVEIPVTADGIDVNALENALKTHKPKFFYCSPNYQEPTGVLFSAENRKAIAALADQYDCIVVEQDDHSYFGSAGELPPYIFSSLNSSAGIIVGSFSQIVGPGVRIGWIAATHPTLMKYFTEAKQKTDSHANGLIQRTLWQYLADNNIEEQVCKVRDLYKAKYSFALAAAEKVFAGKATISPAAGGSYLWVTPTTPGKADNLFDKALAAGVSVIPGVLFGNSSEFAGSFCLSYGGESTDRIARGLDILCSLL